MIELIVLIIFICSLGGALFILIKKIPVLNDLPQNGSIGFKKHPIVSDIENKIKEFFIYFEKQIFLHKFLSWVKVITLKVETKIDSLLHSIRRKAQKIDKDLKDKK